MPKIKGKNIKLQGVCQNVIANFWKFRRDSKDQRCRGKTFPCFLEKLVNVFISIINTEKRTVWKKRCNLLSRKVTKRNKASNKN